MKKTLAWMTWLSLSAVSPAALAVGLGQATVSSYLDAPLEAAVPLLESSGYSLGDIRVSVADQADFAAAGLEWTPLAASVRADVVEHQGRRQVRLSSSQSVQDPWLDLLLAVEFPDGEQFSDLTLLFDPQEYAQQQPSSPPQSQAQGQSQSLVQAQAASPLQPQGRENSNAARNGNGSAYIGRGDTLWGVAERLKPAEASVQQMMMALLEANPTVFPAGNIHGMRAGQTLAVPDAQQVLARSRADAAAAIQAMNEAWRTRSNGAPSSVPETALEADVTANVVADMVAAPVSEVAISAAQTVHNRDIGTPERDQPEALTRRELTEQLRLSQTTLQQMLEERELMRAELNELRGEVTSLTRALSDALAALEQSSQSQSPEPLAASMGETQNSSVGDWILRYQWPLAVAAIGLLMGLLVWLRKRREETWEAEPFAEPVIKPTVSPSVTPKAAAMPEAVHVTYPEQSSESSVDESLNTSDQQPATPQHTPVHKPTSETEPETQPNVDAPASSVVVDDIDTDQWLVEDQGETPSQNGASRYEKSQASGLAEQGRQRRLGLHAVPADGAENVSLAPPPSSMPMSQMLASVSADLPASSSTSAVDMQQTEKTSETSVDPGHRFIDYHPPVLNSTSSSTANSASSSQEGLRKETPMQPTIDFVSEPHAEPLPPAKHPRRPIEEEWEIEEVAFKPRGLDNSDPSKSST